MPGNSGASKATNLIPFSHPDALSEPEKLLAAYFSSSTLGLCILDSDFRFIAINNALADINGLPASEHLGKTVRGALGDFANAVEPELRRVLESGEPVYCEVSARLPSKTEPGHWIAHYIPIPNGDGRVTRIGCVVVEITAQKKLELSLHDVSGKLRIEMDRLQMLLDVTNIVSSDWNLQQAFPRISARIRRVLRHEYGGLEMYDDVTGLLIRQIEDFPLSKGFLSAVRIRTDNSPGGRSLLMRTPAILSKAEMQTFDAEITKGLLAEGIQSLCCVPLFRPKGAVGVLVMGSTRAHAFHPEDLSLLNQVAAQLAIALENDRAAAEVEALRQRLAAEKKHLQDEPRTARLFAEIVGESPALKEVLDQVATVAPSEATVLILGETGTGKELIARAIHRMSRRHDGPFVKVNCAAIPTGLLESELFGHEKGAFTGAVSQKIGRMELAHGGTLLLDEVGEIPLELQPKLLRVLQDQEFERLGGTRTIKVDLRLVAATNRDLAKDLANGDFRRDLFYRLSVFPIRMPALRERPDDIPLLVRHFVRKFAGRMERQIETIPDDTMKALCAWPWPGNVRELENLMERSVILSEGPALRVPLPELYAEHPIQPSGSDRTLDAAEREHILRILRETRGVLSGPSGAARRLGLKRTTLQSKMQRLKITRDEFSRPKRP